MRRIFTLAIATLAMTGIALAQDEEQEPMKYTMVIEDTDGVQTKYDVDLVESVTFEEKEDDNIGWTSLGYCLYGEDFIAGYYDVNYEGEFLCEYYVEVQENDEAPGLYRLVDPYGMDVYPYAKYFNISTDRNYYLEIDATDPNYVFINRQRLSIWEGYGGRIYAYSVAAYYMDHGFTKEEVMDYGFQGTLVDGLVTFPERGLAIEWESAPDMVNYANLYGNFKLDLNTATDSPVAGAPKAGAVLDTREGKQAIDLPAREGVAR